MTDEQIIKYWNEIDSEIINEHGEEFDVYITMPVAKSTVDLINRQKARIKESEEKHAENEELLNDRIQESVNAVSEADQKYICALERSIAAKDVKIERLLQKLQQAKSEALMHAFSKFAGHSDYHGDTILCQLACMAEGKETKSAIPIDMNQIRTKAIKEFAERLKGYPIVENESKEIAYLFVEVRDIDNLVKEMTEGKE